MAKIYKVAFYVVDPNGQYSDKDFLEIDIDNAVDASIAHFSALESKDFEWDDELPINYTDCMAEEFEKHFK